MRNMSMWIGNLDGQRNGLVVASSKKRAREIVGVGHTEFDGYWAKQPGVDPELKPETLYTRPNTGSGRGGERWIQGRCALPKKVLRR